MNAQIQKVEQFFFNGQSFTPEDFLDGVDGIIQEVNTTDDFEIIANTLRSMSAMGKITGITLAKLTHHAKALWIGKGKGDDDKFYTYMEEFSGVRRLTLERYTDAWTAVQSAPAELQDDLLVQPMKNLIALGSKIEQGHAPEGSEWEALASTHSEAEFRNLLRGVTDSEPRKGSLTIYMEDDGGLVAWMDGAKVVVGYLDKESDDPTIKKSVERIVRSSGIVKR